MDMRLSQSLLHQVKYSSLREGDLWPVSWRRSQSLLHQVKYSSPGKEPKEPAPKLPSLNPFFIRSSIHPNPNALMAMVVFWSQSLLHQVKYSSD